MTFGEKKAVAQANFGLLVVTDISLSSWKAELT